MPANIIPYTPRREPSPLGEGLKAIGGGIGQYFLQQKEANMRKAAMVVELWERLPADSPMRAEVMDYVMRTPEVQKGLDDLGVPWSEEGIDWVGRRQAVSLGEGRVGMVSPSGEMDTIHAAPKPQEDADLELRRALTAAREFEKLEREFADKEMTTRPVPGEFGMVQPGYYAPSGNFVPVGKAVDVPPGWDDVMKSYNLAKQNTIFGAPDPGNVYDYVKREFSRKKQAEELPSPLPPPLAGGKGGAFDPSAALDAIEGRSTPREKSFLTKTPSEMLSGFGKKDVERPTSLMDWMRLSPQEMATAIPKSLTRGWKQEPSASPLTRNLSPPGPPGVLNKEAAMREAKQLTDSLKYKVITEEEYRRRLSALLARTGLSTTELAQQMR